MNWLTKTGFVTLLAGTLLIQFGMNAIAEESSSKLLHIDDEVTGLAKTAWSRKINPVHVVVVFSKFKGEAPGDSLAPWWADELFNGKQGSVNHFFDTVSFGHYKVTGEYLPKRYELPYDSTYYRDRKMDEFARNLVKLLDDDPTVNFAQFDNDGPDRIPGSGDDDRFVDYMVLMPRTRPYNFIMNLATGIMTMGLIDPYITNDKNSQGFWIKLDRCSGCIATAINKNQALGSIIAELSHAYGTIDLMDKNWEYPEEDSAGAGFWDILARGTLGWGERDGPVGPCAYNRMKMNSIGLHNTNLEDLLGVHEGVRMKDIGHPEGKVYRIWAGEREYFLIEHRRNDRLYYDRQIPQNGLLIWHVYDLASNSNETMKLCDLECPDGRYKDAGYPLGKIPDPINGGDNLDFWAHSEKYSRIHGGNCGDATDVFDGIRYTTFDSETNPNSYSKVTLEPTGIRIFNIRPEGDEMVFDCIVPPLFNWYDEKYPLVGLSMHRFSTRNAVSNSQSQEKKLFLVNYKSAHRADALVTLSGKSVTVEYLDFMDEYEIQTSIITGLTPDANNRRCSKIIRTNSTPEEFRDAVKVYGLTQEDIGLGEPLQWVQKISLLSGEQSLPVTMKLSQNYPNPFNARTNISYILSSSSPVTLEVYNTLGQRVILRYLGLQEAGQHTTGLNIDSLASGIYLYRLSGRGVSQTRKFTLIR